MPLPQPPSGATSRPPQPNRGRCTRFKRPVVASHGAVAAGPLNREDTAHLRPSADITHLAEPPLAASASAPIRSGVEVAVSAPPRPRCRLAAAQDCPTSSSESEFQAAPEPRGGVPARVRAPRIPRLLPRVRLVELRAAVSLRVLRCGVGHRKPEPLLAAGHHFSVHHGHDQAQQAGACLVGVHRAVVARCSGTWALPPPHRAPARRRCACRRRSASLSPPRGWPSFGLQVRLALK